MSPILKDEINGVDLWQVRAEHPSYRMRALADLQMRSSGTIQEHWIYARDRLGMSYDEFQSRPWRQRDLGVVGQVVKSARGDVIIQRDRDEDARRVCEMADRLRERMGLSSPYFCSSHS